jgi:hypothetical protein
MKVNRDCQHVSSFLDANDLSVASNLETGSGLSLAQD